MTRARSSSAPLSVPSHAALACTLRLRWRISHHAAVAAGLVPADEPRSPVHLDLTLTPTDAARQVAVAAEIVTPRRATPLALEHHAQPAVLRDPDAATIHVDIPGLLHATFTDDPEHAHAPLYARTDLLARLGIPGGRYELVNAPLPTMP